MQILNKRDKILFGDWFLIAKESANRWIAIETLKKTA